MTEQLDTSTAVSRYLEQKPAGRELDASIQLAKSTDGNFEAEIRRVSKQIGVPLESVRTDPVTAKAEAGLAGFDPDEFSQRFPATTRFLIGNADVAHDDRGPLSGLEAKLQNYRSGFSYRRKSVEDMTDAERLLTSGAKPIVTGAEFSQIVDHLKNINPMMSWDEARSAALRSVQDIDNSGGPAVRPFYGTEVTPENVATGLVESLKQGAKRAELGLNMMVGDALGFDTSNQQRQYEQSQAREGLATPDIRSSTGRAVYGGGASLLRNAPGLAASIATGSPLPGLALAGGQTTAESYGKYRVRGGTPSEALLGATGEGAVEVGTELLPMGSLVKAFNLDNALSESTRQLLKSQLQDQFGEQVATALQDAIDTAIANPNKTWSEYLAERPEAAYQTAVATLMQSGALGTAHYVFQNIAQDRLAANERQARADAEAATLAGILNDAKQSKLRERDPQAFTDLVQQQAAEHGAPEDFYIDGRQLQDLLKQADRETVDAVLAAAPSIVTQMPEAVAVGGTVRIPVGEIATAFAGTGLEETLTQHLKSDPNALSASESQTFAQENRDQLQTEAERVLGEQTDRTAWEAASKQVYDNVLEQLNAVGRFAPDVNKAYASLVRDFYSVMAQRQGMTPDALWQQQGLRVTGRLPGAQAADVMVDQAELQQAPYDAETVNFLKAEGLLSDNEAASLLASAKQDSQNDDLDFTRPAGPDRPGVQAGQDLLTTVGGGRPAPGWVGATRVRRKDGRPATAYRGAGGALSATDFGTDRLGFATGNPSSGLGVWFATTQEDAAQYGNVEEFYLDIRNPRVFKIEDLPGFDDTEAAQRFAQDLQAQGYDGIAVDARHLQGPLHFVAFTPETVINKPAEGEVFNQITREQALATNVPVELPADPLFAEAVANTPGAQITDEGLVLDLVRFQKPEQEGAQAIRTGVFYLPAKSADVRHYRSAKTGYGGSERFNAPTLIRRPFFVKGATGGAAPEQAYRELKSKDAFTEMSRAVTQVITRGGNYMRPDPALKLQLIEEFLDQYAPGQTGTAALIERVSREGNTLRYALQELAVAAAVREAGYDAVVGYSKGKAGVRISEVFDVREQTFPARGMDSQVHPDFDPLNQRTQARGTFNPATFEISLLEKADLSTFLHETGHFFLSMMQNFASQPNAPQQIRNDMDALLKWIGVAGDTPEARLADWSARPVAAQREGHEKFAETFEQYLFTGKAPSLELRALFQRFADWLKSVYKTLQEMLSVNQRASLTPEVQGVMDRMLATDEQIKAAENARAMAPMFTSATEARMSPAEWEDYQALTARAQQEGVDEIQARSLRDMRWIGNHKGRVLKDLQKDAAEKRKAVRKEMEADVYGRRVYQTIDFLKRGTVPDANRNNAQRRTLEDIGITGKHKLDLPYLKAMYGEEGNALWRFLPTGQYGYVAVEGMSPDIVADLFGYSSGDEMVRDILEAPPATELIEQLTDQAMLERYGDLADPQSLDRAADEAIHNDVRARLVATEMTSLSRLTGGVRLVTAMAKEYAGRVVAAKKIRDLRPQQSAADAARAGRDADKALKAGDTSAAALAKRNQLLHIEATKAGYEAQREIEKAVNQFKTVFAPNARLAKTRDMDVVNATRALLSGYGFGPAGLNPQEYLAKVQENDPELYADLVSIMGGVPEQVQDYRDLAVGDFRALRDTVLSMWHLSRRSKQVAIDGKLVEIDGIADELVGRVKELSGGELPPLPGYDSTLTRADEFRLGALGIRAALTRVESWADRMGPAFTKYIFQPISESVTRYRDARNTWVAQYIDLLKTIEPRLTFTKITAKELGNFTFNGGKSEVLHAILHTGNESNKRKLLLGRGWAVENEDGTLDTARWDAFIARLAAEGVLTKADFDFAQGVWDLLESVKPEAQRVHKDLYGYYFDEITASAVQTPFGEYRGGYVPAIASAVSSPDQAQRREAEELLHSGNSFMFPSTGRGFTKSRTEYNRPLELDLRTLASHLDKVARFVHIEPAVKDVGRLLINKRISRAVNGFDRSAISEMLNPWLQRTARQTVSVPGKNKMVDHFWNELRKRAGMQVMVANVVNTLQQLTGLSVAAVRVPAPALLRAMKHYIAAPSESADEVAELSPWMKDRMSSQSFEMTAAVRDILINPNVYEKSKAYLERNAYFMQQAMQNVVDVVVWQGSYQNAVKGGASSAEAVRIADADVRLTQSSFAPEDISSFEANTPFVRLFTQFAGYFNMLANTLGSEATKAVRDMGFKASPRLLWIWFAGLAMPAFLSAIMAQGAPDDDDDEDGDGVLDEWLAMFFGSQGRTLTAMVPVAGQAAQFTSNLLDDKRYNDRLSISPALNMVEAGGRTVAAAANGALFDEKVKKTEVRDALTFVGLVTGTPAGALARPAGYAADVASGKAQPETAIEAAVGYTTGR